jgi:hypothetical protein
MESGQGGETMRKKLWAVLAVGAALAVVSGAIAASAGSRIPGPKTIKVVEHPKSDRYVDIGAPGDTTGDLLTFHDPVFDASDDHVVGHDQGWCTRIAPRRGTWECVWTTFLAGGQITVEGPFNDTKDTVVAVTGGTGNFANVRGEMNLKALHDGRYAFTFHLTN